MADHGYRTSADAIEHICTELERGHRCLGADGIEIVPEGIMGRLDLIIDVSDEVPEIAALMAVNFILAHASADIVWDVVIKY